MAKLLCRPILYRSFAFYRFFPYLDQAAGLAVGPTMLLYVLKSTRKPHRLFFLHYILSAAAFVFFAVYMLSPEAVREARILSIINRTDLPCRLFNIVLLLQFTAYLAVSLWAGRQPRWVCSAVSIGYLIFFPAAGGMYIWFFKTHHYFFIFSVVSVVLFMIAGFAYRYLPAVKAAAAPRCEDVLAEAAARLKDYVQSQKPYLDRHLTMAGLSEGAGLSRHQLSNVINSCFSKNYSAFIAELRVEEAKKMLADYADQNITLEYIGYKCGFNSKTSFFTHFKQYTDMTPAEYVKKIRHGITDNEIKDDETGPGPAGGAGKGQLLLVLFILCSGVIITALFGCKKEPSEIVVRRLYGRLVSAAGMDAGAAGLKSGGVIRHLTLFEDGSCRFRWHLYSGIYSHLTAGTYTLNNGYLRFIGRGTARIRHRERVVCRLAAKGSYSKKTERWEMSRRIRCEDAGLGGIGPFYLYEGIGFPVIFAQVTYTKKYLFWGIFLFFMVSLLRRSVLKQEHYAKP